MKTLPQAEPAAKPFRLADPPQAQREAFRAALAALSRQERGVARDARAGKISYERARATLDEASFERVDRVLMMGAMAHYTPRRRKEAATPDTP